MSFFVGLDLGSSMSKGVIINNSSNIIAKYVIKTGFSFSKAAETLMDGLLSLSKISKEKIKQIVATGYGRKNVLFATSSKTEISCHAKGAYYYYPHKSKIIDIGGQDNKVIDIDEKGNIINFKMNRKCAAGTGAFIEETANRLNISLDELENYARNATENITIASFCTVFAQTEIIKLIKEGVSPENLALGIFNSVANRIIEMDILQEKIVLTGGVIAKFPIIKEILEKKTGTEIFIPPFPQFCGAFGAALIGKEITMKN